MSALSQGSTTKGHGLEKGRRLYCPKCHLEIEVLNPCTCTPSAQGLRCCGEEMRQETGVTVNLDD